MGETWFRLLFKLALCFVSCSKRIPIVHLFLGWRSGRCDLLCDLLGSSSGFTSPSDGFSSEESSVQLGPASQSSFLEIWSVFGSQSQVCQAFGHSSEIHSLGIFSEESHRLILATWLSESSASHWYHNVSSSFGGRGSFDVDDFSVDETTVAEGVKLLQIVGFCAEILVSSLLQKATVVSD